MPEQFPRINLHRPADLDHVVKVIDQHAYKIAKMEFGKDLDDDKILEQTIRKVMDRLTIAARRKVERNLLYNGLTPSEYTKLAKGIEPFDEALSRRIQTLAEQSDKLTEEVIAFRKSLPARRADAMARRAVVIRALEEKKEAQRRSFEAAHAQQQLDQELKPITVDLERKEEVARTLQQSVHDITGLQVSILEQATAATEQERLIKRLRTLPP